MVAAKKMVTVSCLDCRNPIDLNYRPIDGQIVTCPHCNADLEVINTHPLELDFYFDDSEADEEWEPHAEADENVPWAEHED